MALTEGPWGGKAVPHSCSLTVFSLHLRSLHCFFFFFEPRRKPRLLKRSKEPPAPARSPIPTAVSEGDQSFRGMEASPPGAFSATKKLRSQPSLGEGCLCEVVIATPHIRNPPNSYTSQAPLASDLLSLPPAHPVLGLGKQLLLPPAAPQPQGLLSFAQEPLEFKEPVLWYLIWIQVDTAQHMAGWPWLLHL